jgi:glycosyltransferase involved in cell wall biosynthesis
MRNQGREITWDLLVEKRFGIRRMRCWLLGAPRRAWTRLTYSPVGDWTLAQWSRPDTIQWEVVGNLVDDSAFYPPVSSRAYSDNGFCILTVASRQPIKDIRTLFRAATIVRAQRPMLRFSISAVGDFRGEGQTFSELSAECGVEDLVSSVSFLERTETAEAMRKARLFVSSSIGETFGIVMAEALACGLPVVATRSGGAEYILGEDSPFLVEPRDHEALACKILEVVDGARPFDALQASESIVRRFGMAAFEARMNRVLSEAIQRQTAGTTAAPIDDGGAQL